MSGEIASFDMFDDDTSSKYRNLVQARNHLEELGAEERRILQGGYFKRWCDHRKVTIESIRELQDKINNICFRSNVARGVGAAAGLASAFAAVVGLVLEAKGDHESAESFNKFRNYSGAASCAVLCSSTIVELGLSQSFMNDVKRVLEKDMELTKPLEEWAKSSREVDILFKEHFQCSITSPIFPEVRKVIGYFFEAASSGFADYQRLLKDLRSFKIKTVEGVTIKVTIEVAETVTKFLLKTWGNSKLRAAVKNIWDIIKDKPSTFEFAKLGSMIYCSIYKALSTSRLSILLTFARIACPEFLCGSALVRVPFDVVTIGFNVVTFILAARNIKEGKSRYSEALDNIINALRSEQENVALHLKYEDDLGLRYLKLC